MIAWDLVKIWYYGNEMKFNILCHVIRGGPLNKRETRAQKQTTLASLPPQSIFANVDARVFFFSPFNPYTTPETCLVAEKVAKCVTLS